MTEQHQDPMTEKQAQGYAPMWGSMITNGDPGRIMYTSIPPETAEYRDQMVEYIESELYPLADEEDAGPDEEDEFEYNDSQQLRRLVAYLKGIDYLAPETVNGIDLVEFVDHYIIAMLFATTDESDESGGEPMDSNYGPSDLAPGELKAITDDCRVFLQAVGQYITRENYIGRTSSGASVTALAGHDFFLTRCGHGAGFWDGDWKSDDLPGSEKGPLTKAAKNLGEVSPYIGDDGMVYHG